MIKADTHTHSHFSTDSNATIDEMIVAAIKAGLNIYTITDHYDYNNHYHLVKSAVLEGTKEGDFIFEPAEYCEAILSAKDKWKEHIDLRLGVEYGLQPDLGNELNDFVNKYPFDYVIGSIHEVQGVDPYFKEFVDGRSIKEAWHLYFQTELLCIKACDDFDSFGHIDYGLRYHHELLDGRRLDFKEFIDEIDEILRLIIDKGKGLEFNTKSLVAFDNNESPSILAMKRYKELGGELITIGSDAHRASDVAKEFKKTEDILKGIGYRYYSVYKNRRPEFYEL